MAIHLSPPIDSPAEQRGRWYDRLGAGFAALCAVHCAVLPFSVALLAFLGLGFLASHEFELVFLVFSTVFGALSVGHSLRHHGRFHAWGLLLAGLGILWFERLIPAIHDQALAHAAVMSLGGLLVASAHWVNLRRAHGGPACARPHPHWDEVLDSRASLKHNNDAGEFDGQG